MSREVGEGEGISRRGEANEDCRRKYAARQCIRRFITRAKGVAWERMSNDIFARMRGVSRSWGYARVLLAFPKTCGRRSGRFAVDLPVVCWETTSYLWSSRTPGSLKYIYIRRETRPLSVIYFLCSLFLRISWFWLFKSIFCRYYYFSSWISIQKFFVVDFLEKERERERQFLLSYILFNNASNKETKEEFIQGIFWEI